MYSSVGQQAHSENESGEVNSPLKTKAQLKRKEGISDATGQEIEGKVKTTAQWKRLAREKGKNKSPTKGVQLPSSGSKREGKLLFEEETEIYQKKQRIETMEVQNQIDERSAVTARQHRREP